MAEALIPNASLALLKEVYLLGRFVVQTTQTGLHHEAERSQLLEKLDFEHLFIKTFAVTLFERGGILLNNININEQWLAKINNILEVYRTILKDYATLAAKRDDAYRKFSPFTFEQGTEQLLLDFNEFDQQVQAVGSNSEEQIIPIGTESGASVVVPAEAEKVKKRPAFDLKFAFFDKSKLEKILAKQKECREKLESIIQLTMAFNPVPSASASSSRPNDSDTAVLGLASHTRVLQLNEAIEIEDITPVDLQKEGYELELPDRADGLALAHIRQVDLAGGTRLDNDALVEQKKIDGTSGAAQEENRERILKLAKVLLASHPDLGTLPLRGYWPSNDTISFVFNFPERVVSSSPVSLYDLISRGRTLGRQLSLPLRFHVAQRLAKTLAAFHADKWVHKSFRSRSIVFFKQLENAALNFKNPYLVNFEYARTLDTMTKWDVDEDVERNLYRHPDRQNTPRKSFNKIHDLYALGVVLLEIGFWKPVIRLKSEIEETLPKDSFLDPDLFMEKLIEKAVNDLPHPMGPAYASAVEVCLKGSFGVGVDHPGFSLVVQNRIVEEVGIDRLSLDF